MRDKQHAVATNTTVDFRPAWVVPPDRSQLGRMLLGIKLNPFQLRQHLTWLDTQVHRLFTHSCFVYKVETSTRTPDEHKIHLAGTLHAPCVPSSLDSEGRMEPLPSCIRQRHWVWKNLFCLIIHAAKRRRQRGWKETDRAARMEGRRKVETQLGLKYKGLSLGTYSLGACHLGA